MKTSTGIIDYHLKTRMEEVLSKFSFSGRITDDFFEDAVGKKGPIFFIKKPLKSCQKF
jgi:hypothetical protein